MLALAIDAAEHAVVEQHVVFVAHDRRFKPAVIDAPRPRTIHDLTHVILTLRPAQDSGWSKGYMHRLVSAHVHRNLFYI